MRAPGQLRLAVAGRPRRAGQEEQGQERRPQVQRLVERLGQGAKKVFNKMETIKWLCSRSNMSQLVTGGSWLGIVPLFALVGLTIFTRHLAFLKNGGG